VTNRVFCYGDSVANGVRAVVDDHMPATLDIAK